ncbi:MAG: S4 domain-containing protein, partial [Rhodospirillales bacterium]|nr:S4 domain-containing protein [Rhodospirillales bacterium]
MTEDASPTTQPGERLTLTIAQGEAGGRLDKVLSQSFPAHSRTRIKALIEAGKVTLEGRTVTEPSWRVKPGEAWVITVPPTVAAKPAAQFMELKVVYEDDQLIVIDKPAGLVVHPAPGNPDRT